MNEYELYFSKKKIGDLLERVKTDRIEKLTEGRWSKELIVYLEMQELTEDQSTTLKYYLDTDPNNYDIQNSGVPNSFSLLKKTKTDKSITVDPTKIKEAGSLLIIVVNCTLTLITISIISVLIIAYSKNPTDILKIVIPITGLIYLIFIVGIFVNLYRVGRLFQKCEY